MCIISYLPFADKGVFENGALTRLRAFEEVRSEVGFTPVLLRFHSDFTPTVVLYGFCMGVLYGFLVKFLSSSCKVLVKLRPLHVVFCMGSDQDL